MEKYIILNDSDEIIDIVNTDLGENDPYFFIKPNCKKIKVNLDIEFPVNQNIYFLLYQDLLKKIENCENRLQLIENMLFEEILYNPNFGRSQTEKLNVKYSDLEFSK